MPLIVADTRTTPDGADSTTGWTGSAALNLFTTDPNPVELTGCLGMAVGTTTDDIYFTIASADLTDTLVYVWVLANGTMDTLVNGGIALQLNDGTDGIGYHLAGSDIAAFRHAEGPVGWQCLLLDTSVLPANATAYAGVIANLTVTAITGIGAGFTTLSKALGGASNCFTDVIRYGNDGLIITGGLAGSPAASGKFDEIAIEDRSDADTKAYGIIRELGAGLYGLQGPLTFGDTVGTVATYFADTNTTVTFEDRGIGTAKYYINIVGNATGSTTFQLGTKVGATGGSEGCTISCPPGVGASFDATDVDLQFCLIYGSTITGFENGISFSTDATNAPNHETYDTSFSGNGQIAPGLTSFKNNAIAASTDALGSMLLPTTTADVSELSFTSDGTGHAIYITSTGTYNFTNFTYSGFGAGATTDATVYNNSGGLVTINVIGGDTPTVRNGAGASTVVNNSVTLLVQGITEGSAAKMIANETVGTITSGDVLFEILADANGEAISSINYEGAFEPTGLDVITRVRSSGLPNAAIQDDNGVFTDETTAANSAIAADMNLLPATPVVNEDRYLFGHPEMFGKVKLDINTAGTGNYTITWQYWNGTTWAALSNVVDDTVGGSPVLHNSFSVLGLNYITFDIPGDWATTTINSQGPFYYIRAAFTAGAVTIPPTGTRCSLDVTKYLPFVQDGTITSSGLTVTASWVEDVIAKFKPI